MRKFLKIQAIKDQFIAARTAILESFDTYLKEHDNNIEFDTDRLIDCIDFVEEKRRFVPIKLIRIQNSDRSYTIELYYKDAVEVNDYGFENCEDYVDELNDLNLGELSNLVYYIDYFSNVND